MSGNTLKVSLEGWNFCNFAGPDAVPSPRYADCLDSSGRVGPGPSGNLATDSDNRLSLPTPIPGLSNQTKDADLYAEEKERYLGTLCSTSSSAGNWSYWTQMLKSGNFNISQNLCPRAGGSLRHAQNVRNVAYGTLGPMNQPLVFHNWSSSDSHEGAFYGTYDVDPKSETYNSSYFEIRWFKRPGENSWSLQSTLITSKVHPYLMLYNRADSVRLGNGGYPWEGRGVLVRPARSPSFRMQVNLTVMNCTSTGAQFYMPEMGGCWKNDGRDCDGDLATDVTRYICFIINPGVVERKGCRVDRQSRCPPFHTFANGTKAYRNETTRFPYECYHLWCAPPNDPTAPPGETCDPYSNPMSQELMQLLPCKEWGLYDFPSQPGEAWIGHGQVWNLKAGALAEKVYFSGKDPPNGRYWLSTEIGPEVFESESFTKWEVSKWDIQDIIS
ncbi:uncharacterized protein [Oscarella lobularis]